jgi:hypothetical protein
LQANIELKKNPFPFILSKGDPISILQILATINRLGTRPGFNSLTAVVSAQNDDGAFPKDFQEGFPSSVKTTYRAIKTLYKVGIDKGSYIMSSALNWLFKQQNADGGWHENPAINLPEWMTWESTNKSVTWYTCQIGILLQQLQMQNTNTFKKIIDFFESSELPIGGWSAVKGLNERDNDSTVGIANFLAQVVGEHHPTIPRAKTIFDTGIAKLVAQVKSQRVEDAYELTHLVFDEPKNFMYRSGDERVMILLRALIEAQREDGGWLTFYSGGKSDVPVSVYSLNVLVSHSVLDKSILQNMFDAALKD